MALTAQHPVISKLSESPGHISLLGISGSPNRLLLNECSSPWQRGQERHSGQTEQKVERLGAQRHSGRFSTCNDTLGKLHSLKGPGNLMGTKLDVSKLGGTLGPPPSLPQAVRHLFIVDIVSLASIRRCLGTWPLGSVIAITLVWKR